MTPRLYRIFFHHYSQKDSRVGTDCFIGADSRESALRGLGLLSP